jgi:hypothetical protein
MKFLSSYKSSIILVCFSIIGLAFGLTGLMIGLSSGFLIGLMIFGIEKEE